MNTNAFATIKPEFKMTKEEIELLQAMPDNSPETKLTQKQKDIVSHIYYKYIANKVVRGWGQDLAEFEQKEKWPSGPRLKRHEAQRMILGNLIELNLYRDNMTAEQAASKFFSCITCRESYTILISKVYKINQLINK
jgi:hypothetical protein